MKYSLRQKYVMVLEKIYLTGGDKVQFIALGELYQFSLEISRALPIPIPTPSLWSETLWSSLLCHHS